MQVWSPAHSLRAKFGEPDGSHLSPAGEYNLRLGIMKELKPDMIATHESDVKVFELKVQTLEEQIKRQTDLIADLNAKVATSDHDAV